MKVKLYNLYLIVSKAKRDLREKPVDGNIQLSKKPLKY